jgi:N-acetyl-anhydromuramyl-L-alanine amidase AmpD
MPTENRDFKNRTQGVGLIVITYSVSTDKGITLATLNTNGASIHNLFEETGRETYKLDQNTQVSFCCGRSRFRNEPSVNEYSINLMLINDAESPFKPEQIDALRASLQKIQTNFPYLDMRKNIVGLGEVAIIEAKLVEKDGKQVYLVELGGEQVILEEGEGKTFPRHIAPGKYFGVVWEMLAKDYNIGLFKETTAKEKETPYFNENNPTRAEVLTLQDKLITYGYPLDKSGIYDKATKEWIIRFNEHYVPDPSLQKSDNNSTLLDPRVWSVASEKSLDYILNYINTKTNTVNSSLFKPIAPESDATTSQVAQLNIR